MSSSNASDEAGWHRWAQVKAHVPSDRALYRASSPNYQGYDTTQRLTQLSVDFLSHMHVKGVISFNQYPYTSEEKARLDVASIAYLHLPVQDYHAATRAQLEAANEFFLGHKCVLVHCGYGYGRTGTGVTAIQLYHTNGRLPIKADWKSVNHVEKDEQVAILSELAEVLVSKVSAEYRYLDHCADNPFSWH